MNTNTPQRKVILSKEVLEFLSGLNLKAQKKIGTVIERIINGEMNIEIFKKLVNTDIWEIRTEYMGIEYRLLSFWDTRTETLIITTHGFIKKTQKTPQKEIDKAIQKMNEYFNK